jgi:hypothetical protein
MQSFQEAVYHGVPLLGIPFMGDQKYNARKIVTEDIGLQLILREVTKETLLRTINTILNDTRFVLIEFTDVSYNGNCVYAIRNIQEYKHCLVLNRAHQLLVYADDVNSIRENINILKHAGSMRCL